jgi:uncharacterized protein YndB with AHSA1/START domain
VNGAGVIERRVFIEASPETVFSFLVEPELMARWIGRSPQHPRNLAACFELTSLLAVDGWPLVHTEVSPPHRLAFTFGWKGQGALPPGRSVVEFGLVPQQIGTLLGFRHSGLPDAPPEVSAERHEDHWSIYLSRLREAV